MLINFDQMVKLSLHSINDSYDHYFNNIKSIILCGNGLNGYSNTSGKYIDSHQIVIRINNFVAIEDATGIKKDFLFCGASVSDHLNNNEFYPEINNFYNLIGSIGVLDRLKNKKIINKSHKILFYDNLLFKDIFSSHGYSKSTGISGLHAALLLLAIQKKYNIPKINFIGFDTNNADNNIENMSQKYYYGNKKTLEIHFLNHDWLFHDAFYKMIYEKFPLYKD